MARTQSWWVNASSLAAVRRSWSGGGAVARVTWAGTAWKLALIDPVDGHGRPGGSELFCENQVLFVLLVGTLLLPCRMLLVGHYRTVGRLLLGTLSAW